MMYSKYFFYDLFHNSWDIWDLFHKSRIHIRGYWGLWGINPWDNHMDPNPDEEKMIQMRTVEYLR